MTTETGLHSSCRRVPMLAVSALPGERHSGSALGPGNYGSNCGTATKMCTVEFICTAVWADPLPRRQGVARNSAGDALGS